MGITVVAALWGFAEATLFFVVADVWLTVVAFRHGPLRALHACIPAALGAVAGGALMFLWGALDPPSVQEALDAIPAIGDQMIGGVRDALRADGLIAMGIGAFSGVPFKVYASQAPAVGISLALFLGVGLAARLARFVLVAVIAGWIGHGLGRIAGPGPALWLLAGFWILFYGFYWAATPG